MIEKYISVSGARENNLKNVDVKIPHGKHTVISGVSGSGKSTLAYDVIYAAGQKKLLDCLSEQVKLFTSKIKQPDINYIKGLTPVVSLKQYEPRKNPRATIGTLSEVSTYLRYLFSLLGVSRCGICNKSYPVRSLHQIIKELQKLPLNTIIEILAPVYKPNNKKYEEFFDELRNKGYKRIEIDGVRKNLRDWIEIEETPQTMMVCLDKIQIKEELSRSDIHSISKAIELGDGFIKVVIRNEDNDFLKKHGCINHGMLCVDIKPSFFSFNDLTSSCEECYGTGIKKKASPLTLIQNKTKTLRQGPFYPGIYKMNHPFNFLRMYSLAKHYDFSLDIPFEELSDEVKEIIFYGTKGNSFPLVAPDDFNKPLPTYSAKIGDKIEFIGLVNWVKKYYQNKQGAELTEAEKNFFNKFMIDEECTTCKGTRLKPQRELITVNGFSYHQLGQLDLVELKDFVEKIEINEDNKNALEPIISELKSRINSLLNIGLGYLNLNRRADTLSGGEYQRVRMAGQIGSSLMGLTYVIDEPTVGLHGMDNDKVVRILENLCDQGNTVITIEHDIDIIKKADYIVEIGPGAGVNGGEVIASGSLEDIQKSNKSIISSYLKPKKYQLKNNIKIDLSNSIKIIEASENNLKNIDVTIPLNSLVCITGLSGSGKSSLAIDILFKSFWSKLHDARVIPGKYKRIEGMEKIKDIYCIDQSSIGRSKRSIPATFIGVFDAIRTLFANSEDGVKYGYNDESYYSFNAKGGCTSCKGMGYLDTHIHYLGDLQTTCPECNGNRYTSDVLEVCYKGKNIKEVLDLDFEKALDFFKDNEYIYNKIKYVYDLGLGYMTLGQPMFSISGGEAQRLSLSKELSKVRGKKNMLYILDEPTTGLHAQDIEKLVKAMKSLVENKNSLVIIEHNPEVIIEADYIIDIGPDAGKYGGEVVAAGNLKDILESPVSKTGKYLKTYLGLE